MRIIGRNLIGLMILLAAAACSPSSPTNEPDTATPIPITDAPITTPPPVSSPSPTPQVEPVTPSPAAPEITPTTAEPEPTPMAAEGRAELTAEGPWLLFLASSDPEAPPYLWAVNSDGSGLGRLSDEPVLNFAVFPGQTPYGGGLVATINTSAENLYHDLSLNLLSLPAGSSTRVTALTSEETRLQVGEEVSDAKMDIAMGISHYDSLSWSPDGRWLAFAGAMHGPSVDLYSYELENGTIRWLTDGPSHAFQFLWPADSSLILHSGREIFLGAGGPYEGGQGIWGAAPDESELITYEGPKPAHFVGWQDASHLLIDSGPKNGCMTWGRVLDLSAETIEPNGLDCFGPVAYDLTGGMALAYTRNPGTDQEAWGIDLVNFKTGAVIDVTDQLAYEIYWDDYAELFVMWGDFGPMAVTLDGEMTEAPTFSLMPSPDEQFAAHYSLPAAGQGVWVSAKNTEPVKLLDEDGRWLGWSPDSKALYVVTRNGDLYLLLAEPLEAIQLSAGVWPRQSWILPENEWYTAWAP